MRSHGWWTGFVLALALALSAGAAIAAPADEPGRGFGSYSPQAALWTGIGATLAPAALAVTLDPIGGDAVLAWEAALALGIGTGVVVGPAVGLASGGRGDLAARGLLVRVIGAGATGAGLYGIALMFGDDAGAGGWSVILLGCVGALVTGISGIHDLAITPSAVARGRPARAALVARPDGSLAVRVTF